MAYESVSETDKLSSVENGVLIEEKYSQ